MADPLSVAASIIAVLQLSGTVVNFLTTAYKATEDRNKIITEISYATGILFNLKELAERAQRGDDWALTMQSLAVPQGPIAQFKSALEDLYRKLKPGVGLNTLVKSLKWPFQKDQVKEILNSLERQKSTFLIALNMDHIRLSQVLESNIYGMKEKLNLISNTVGDVNDSWKRQEFQQVLDWLSPLTFGAKQNDMFEERQGGTGEWFLQSQEFQQWLNGSSRSIWCPGSPGAGKTVMVSIAINHLEKLCIDTDTSLAYVYFNYEEREDQTAGNMLGSILRQLIQRRGAVPGHVMELYKSHAGRKTRLKLNETSKLLLSEVLGNQKTFIVIDALDECVVHNNTKELFIDELSKLSRTAKLMLTSRPDATIMDKIEDATHLEIQATNADVANYVQKRLEEDIRLKRHVEGDEELKVAITTRLVQNARGLFLLPRLHLNAFRDKKRKRDVKLALENLTRELVPIYNSAMERIKDGDIDLAKQVLSWIFHSSRPLGVEEIRHALAVEPGQRDFDKDCLLDKDDIVSACAGLVTIDRAGRIMHFTHQSVQEYLQAIQNHLFPTAQEYITRTCLTYLLFDAFSIQAEMTDGNIHRLSSEYPLLPYAAQYWGYHACRGLERTLRDLILEFLERAPKIAYFVMHTSTYRFGASGRRTVIDAPRLQVAASFGLKETVKALLEEGNDIEARSSDGWTALSAAAWNGQEGVIEILLEKGADIEAKNDVGWTALAKACRNEHLGVIRILLAKGANIETKSNTGWTPLLGAAWHGNESVVRLLLENGANVETKNNGEWTALHQVASHGDDVLVRLLLDNGASVHARSNWGWTPLLSAVTAKFGNEDRTVELLLEAGSDKTVRDTRHETAYDKAAQLRRITIMELLR